MSNIASTFASILVLVALHHLTLLVWLLHPPAIGMVFVTGAVLYTTLAILIAIELGYEGNV